MSVSDNDLDLEKMLLPAWAKESASTERFAHYTGEESDTYGQRGERRSGRGFDRNRPPRREGDGGPRQGGGGRPGGGPRPGGPGRFPRGDRQGRPDRRGGDDRRGEGRDRGERRPEVPLPEIQVAITVDDKGADSLARQIRMTGRAYPVFDIGRIILQKPERHQFVFSTVKKPEGQTAQPLFLCMLDDTLWLSEEEAVSYALDKHFNTFYQTERTATEPPKGVYTFVAQCGMSGVILGPPNYHDYQPRLRKLHAERFSRMPFEAFKARVKIVKDEAVVKKWIEDQSWKTDYVCLNMPEPLRLANREAVEKHFRETHLPNIIRPVETHTLSGVAARGLRCHGLARLVRAAWEDQRRFPLKLVTSLSQQFAARGLQFFKRDKSVTHVCVARPRFLDLESEPVSDGIKNIINFINANPKCTRPVLFEKLAPAPAAPAAPAEPAAAPAGAEAPAPAVPEMTPEQAQLASDLHWLIHQGNVIEFANGILETAKKPMPRPPKPEPKAAAAGAPAQPAEAPAAAEEPALPEVTEIPAETPAAAPAEPAPAPMVAEEPSAQAQQQQQQQ